MQHKILLVDDEPDVLRSFEALFRRRYSVYTALSGKKSLEIMESEGPFAAIIADMHMPQMDGITLLIEVGKRFPDTIRIMLTANADQKTAAQAVNQGQIFRFLNKPCSMDIMLQTLHSATEQYRLITAERELLEKTLTGSVNVLVEALSLTNPIAFQRTQRIQQIVQELIQKLAMTNRWEAEIATALSQIGCLTIPSELLQKAMHGLPLNPKENKIFHHHPVAGSKLIGHIPRMGRVARIIALQMTDYREIEESDNDPITKQGAELLRIAIDFDTLIFRGTVHNAAIQELSRQPQRYNSKLVALLEPQRAPTIGEPQKIHVANLQNGMMVAENIHSINGLLVVPGRFEISDTVRHRLINFAEQELIPTSINVFIPEGLL